MRANLRFVVILGVLIAGILALLGWHRRTTDALRAELDRQRASVARLQAARAAEQQEQQLAAVRARTEELDRLLAERTAVARLREELTALRQRANETTSPPADRARTERPSIVRNVLAFPLWQNAGRATPEAAFETGLWASVNGDIDTLTSLLVLDSEARNEAAALYARLPESLRQEFVSPERLIAVLAAKDVPLGSATILDLYPATNETKVSAQIFDAEGKHKLALLSLRPDDAGWKFVVPTNAVKRYAAWLRAPAVTPPPAGAR